MLISKFKLSAVENGWLLTADGDCFDKKVWVITDLNQLPEIVSLNGKDPKALGPVQAVLAVKDAIQSCVQIDCSGAGVIPDYTEAAKRAIMAMNNVVEDGQ